MKIQKETALFQTAFGSHLYGTNTPTSDYDFKVICLPNHDDLILNLRVSNRVEKPEGWTEGKKMLTDQVEREFIPLQIFLDHFIEGQTYAVEIAFAVLQNRFQTFNSLGIDIRVWMKELIDKYSNRNIQKMVGYAISQAQQYGLKTSRFNVLVEIDAILGAFSGELGIGAAPALVQSLLAMGAKEISIMNGAGGHRPAPGIEICGKQFTLTTQVKTLHGVIKKTLSGYGNRAKDHRGQPADWKALSHAIRIVEQLLEFTRTKSISFPRPNAAFLLDVKNAKVELDHATEYLTQRFNEIDAAVDSSVLVARDGEMDQQFTGFKLKLLKTYYGL